jgi:hypothetical protein
MAIAVRVARAMADGPFVCDFEFLAVMRFERPRFRELVTELEEGKALCRPHERMIDFALLNATLFPHRREDLLVDMVGADMATIVLVDTWWNRTGKPIQIVQASLCAGPVIVDGRCYRGVHYATPRGEGLITEVWVDDSWRLTWECSEETENPGLPTLELLPPSPELELQEHGVRHWQVPDKYNPFVRGQKRRQRRKWRARIE